ncbi:MAG: Flp pilus assembly protein CpaB [Pseudomonadota bacterium]
MRGLFGLVLLAGMGLAGFAVYLVSQQLETQEAQLARERQLRAQAVQTTEIYAPARDLTYGELVLPEDIKLIPYPSNSLPEGVFASEEELFPEGVSVPRVVTAPMRVNEPILDNKVTEAGAPRGLTALLDPGTRAFPLPDGLTRAFAGELRTTDRIDLYWVGQINQGQRISRLVKSGLEIIAIEEPDVDGEGGGRGVVVQVSQADFADLQVLQAAGDLSLTPVARTDEVGGDVNIETSIEDVLGIEEVIIAPEPEAEPEPERCFVTQGFGANAVQIEIDCTD